jgi:membrane associated rhomboid family serine protease
MIGSSPRSLGASGSIAGVFGSLAYFYYQNKQNNGDAGSY